MIVFELISTILLADFVSGFVHWAEDAYARPGMRFVHKIAEENQLHHARPREFLKKNWWQSSLDIAALSAFAIAGAWAVGLLTWHVWLFAVISSNANQVHKWAHRNRTENSWLIRALQRVYLLQTPRHHARHHGGEKNSHYCVITNFLNPLLEEIELWKRLERANLRLFGLVRQPESIPGKAKPGEIATSNNVHKLVATTLTAITEVKLPEHFAQQATNRAQS